MTELQSIHHQEQVSAARAEFLKLWEETQKGTPHCRNSALMQAHWTVWLASRNLIIKTK